MLLSTLIGSTSCFPMAEPSRDDGPRFVTVHSRPAQQSVPDTSPGNHMIVSMDYERPNSNSCADRLSAVPLVTAFSIIIMISFFIWTFINSFSHAPSPASRFGMIPYYLVELGEYWRLFTPGFFHHSVLHISMNMLAAFYISSTIEQFIGSICMLGLIFVFAFVPQVISLACYYLGYAITDDVTLVLTTAAGYSCHIFGYIVVQIVLFDVENCSIYGWFELSADLVPWFLLIITSFFFESVSFIGHLAGILTAYLYVYGLLNWMSLPRSWLVNLETYVPHFISSSSRYVPTPAVQNELLHQKNLSFLEPSSSSSSPRSTSRSKAIHSSPGHILGGEDGLANASGPSHVLGGTGPNARQHQVRNTKVLPIDSALSSSLSLEQDVSNIPTSGMLDESQNGPILSIHQANRKRGQYSELIDEEEVPERM